MKTGLLLIVLVICIPSLAQDAYHKPGTGFNSVFQKLKSGKYEGTVTGNIILKINEQQKIISFYKDKASLNIEPDKNEIYDVSFKRYSTKCNHLEIEYSTYNNANALVIKTNEGTYKLTLIDGDCESVINGLEYEYVDAGNKELLVLHCSNDLKLPKVAGEGAITLYLLKGSTLVYNIPKK